MIQLRVLTGLRTGSAHARVRSRHAARMTALVAFPLACLMADRTANAQSYGQSTRALLPSQSSPSRAISVGTVGRSFARQGLYTEGTPLTTGRRSTVRNSASTARSTFSGRPSGPRPNNRLTSFTSGAGGYYGSLLGGYGGGGLLNFSSAGIDPSGTAMSRTYRDVAVGNWAAGIPTPMRSTTIDGHVRRTWAPPAGALQGPLAAGPATRPSEGSGPAGSDALVAVETLVSNQLSSQRQAYLDAGWAAFKDGRYQTACSKFTLAERCCVGVTREHAEARIASLYGRFAARQYAEAGNSLNWLLQTYVNQAPGGDASIVDLMPDLTGRYSRASELDAQLNGVGGLGDYILSLQNALNIAQSRGGSNARAQQEQMRLARTWLNARSLRAMVTFAMPGQRGAARFEAQTIVAEMNAADGSLPWKNLTLLLAEPTAGARPDDLPAPKEPAAPDFPFNLFRDSPPPQPLTSPVSR